MDNERCIFLTKNKEPTVCKCLSKVICSERPCPFYKSIGEYEFTDFTDSNGIRHYDGVKRRD